VGAVDALRSDEGCSGAARVARPLPEEDHRRFPAQRRGLPDAGKQRLQEISHELAEITGRFGQNVLDATVEWELVITDEAKLAGLPPSAVAAAKESAEKKGKSGYRFTLQAPSYIALVTYLEDASIREQAYRAYNARAASGPLDNGPLIRRILNLRDEQARLLGYANFGDLVLEDRMAKKAERARDFVADLTARSRESFARETRELLGFRRSLPGDDGRRWSRGTSRTTRRSSERRSTTSTRKSSGRISRWIARWRASSRRRTASTACASSRTASCRRGTRT